MSKRHKNLLTAAAVLFLLYIAFVFILPGCSGGKSDKSAPGTIDSNAALTPSPTPSPAPATAPNSQTASIIKYAYASAKDGAGIDVYGINYTTGAFSWVKKMDITSPYKMCFSHKKRSDGNSQYLYAAGKTIVKRFNLDGFAIDDTWNGLAGTQLRDIEITSAPEDKYLYALETNNSTVICADVDNLTSTVINMDAGSNLAGIALTPSGSRLALADSGFGPDAPYLDKYRIPVIKTSNNSFDYTKKTLWGKPIDLAIDPDGAYAYILSVDDNRLIILDIASPENFDYVDLPYRPTGIAITPDGQYGYITSFSNDKVMIVSLRGLNGTNVLAAKIDVKAGPLYPGVSSDGKYLWVPCYTDNKICVVKIENSVNTTEKTFTNSAGPWHIIAE